ncbi:protein phosphatase 2c (macronuclear) [Tetrahymena thermophila SB210]|uniref:Protein phosphatase 2c n=1 Tax=Tetrahymena thermophila (strain SB210) TaxID=312017 RepID=W7WW22_TETTS|nr:protein phosphatase 2c [Tetrahymena thermophila SB210]EWS71030.1 protein phosphatase 2c [Tetrahymena thermophila SB210]|eukprot:XP_012656438.1 protein phosphatase 2c [Tetrahymena thermophila SB210]
MKNLKLEIKGNIDKNNFFYFENIGKREYMEDRSIIYKDDFIQFYAILDGHGGSAVVDFVQNYLFDFIRQHNFKKLYQQYLKQKIKRQQTVNAMKNIFKELQKEIYKQVQQKFQNKDSSGDSALYRFSKSRGLIMLNKQDVIGEKQEQKIIKNGGWVQDNRVCGKLQMARSIGDLDVQKFMDYKFTSIVEKKKKKQQLFILCSDGLSDIFEYDQNLKKNCWNKLCQTLNQECTVKYLTKLIKDQIQNQIDDNISFIIFFC